MKSIVSQLLFASIPPPTSRGRRVRFDIDEPDIILATGPLDERITTLLNRRGYPMSAREIAAGINSNTAQVNKGLRVLMGRGHIEAVHVPGGLREYILKSPLNAAQ